MLEQVKQYAIEKHRATNHKYNEHHYDFHLQMVVDVAKQFIHLIPEKDRDNVLGGCWTHDIIEDARETYNDVKQATNENIADLAYALTNEKGKNRKERANDKYYEGIRNTPYAAFIKFCDRIANYKFSVSKGSGMKKMYEKENMNFLMKLYSKDVHPLAQHLCELMGEGHENDVDCIIGMNAMAEEERLREEKNKETINHVIAKMGEEWWEELKGILDLDGDFNCYTDPAMVKAPKGKKHEIKNGKLIKQRWINPHIDGGMEGDHYEGEVFFKINDDVYLVFWYNL